MKDDKYYLDLEAKGHFDTLDKRSKEYREYKDWKSYNKVQDNVKDANTVGLGDVVEAVTKATGIKKVVESITDDCGCDERKKKLNKVPLWKRTKVNCIEQDDYVWLKALLRTNPKKFKYENRKRIVLVYNRIFNTKVKNTSCYSCIRGYLDNLKRYLEVYES